MISTRPALHRCDRGPLLIRNDRGRLSSRRPLTCFELWLQLSLNMIYRAVTRRTDGTPDRKWDCSIFLTADRHKLLVPLRRVPSQPLPPNRARRSPVPPVQCPQFVSRVPMSFVSALSLPITADASSEKPPCHLANRLDNCLIPSLFGRLSRPG